MINKITIEELFENDMFKEDLPKVIQKYGTSEGVSRSWDTRGRGQKNPKVEEKRGKQVAVGVIKGPEKDYVLTVDNDKFRNYISKVKEMQVVSGYMHDASIENKTEWSRELFKLDNERRLMHNTLAEKTAKEFEISHPEWKGNHVNLFNTIRQEIESMSDKIISHIGKSIRNG